MKRMIRCSQEVTNNQLNDLFKKIDWDDVDYADRLIDRTIKKELGVTQVFDQAKYINMLDPDTRYELMNLLSDPKAIHARRIKNRKKSSKTSSTKCILDVVYEDYPDGNIVEDEFEGSSRLDALKHMVDNMLIYVDRAQIEDDAMTAEDIIQSLEERNGDGCDFIIKLTDASTHEVLMDYTDSYDTDMLSD